MNGFAWFFTRRVYFGGSGGGGVKEQSIIFSGWSRSRSGFRILIYYPNFIRMDLHENFTTGVNRAKDQTITFFSWSWLQPGSRIRIMINIFGGGLQSLTDSLSSYYNGITHELTDIYDKKGGKTLKSLVGSGWRWAYNPAKLASGRCEVETGPWCLWRINV